MGRAGLLHIVKKGLSGAELLHEGPAPDRRQRCAVTKLSAGFRPRLDPCSVASSVLCRLPKPQLLHVLKWANNSASFTGCCEE